VVCACLTVTAAAYAQKQNSGSAQTVAVASSLLKSSSKVPIIIVGSAARAGWKITKFTTVRIAKPIAKTLVVRGAPKATLFVLKSTGVGAKYLLPWAVKLSVL
jgi:hypothetical protein